MDRDMCLNNSCVMKSKCLRYMGKVDAVQSYFPFTPIRNNVKAFRCIGKVDLYLHHNKKYKPKNHVEYAVIDDHSKVIEEAPMYRITQDANVISTNGNPKIIKQFLDKKDIYVRLYVDGGKRRTFGIKFLMNKYFPNN